MRQAEYVAAEQRAIERGYDALVCRAGVGLRVMTLPVLGSQISTATRCAGYFVSTRPCPTEPGESFKAVVLHGSTNHPARWLDLLECRVGPRGGKSASAVSGKRAIAHVPVEFAIEKGEI